MWAQWLVVLGCLAATWAQQPPKIVGVVEQNLRTYTGFWMASFAPDGKYTNITNLFTLGLLVNNDFTVMPDRTAIAFTSFDLSFMKFYLNVVDYEGTLVSQWAYPDPFSNVQYDAVSKRLFGITVHQKAVTTFVEVDLSSGALTPLLSNMAYSPQLGLSSYCPHCHIFWGVSEDNSLVKINTAQNTVAAVPINATVIMIVWDYNTNTMYAFTRDNALTVHLVTVDVKTGEILKNIADFPGYEGYGTGAAGIDVTTGTLYASLVIPSGGQDMPVWVVVDTKTGTFTTQQTDPSLGYPISIAFIY